jgi:outer membrane protein OmpA-like peptidoglycan-associated protein
MRATHCAVWIAAAVCGLAACDQTTPDAPAAPDTADVAGSDVEAPPPKTSIIRPSVLAEVQPDPATPPDPIEDKVLFEVSSTELSDSAREMLDALLATEGMTGGAWRIGLTGRTDASGNADMNLRLAEARAETVRNHLVEGGVPASRLEITAAGEPEDASADEAAKAAARRVDVRAEPVIEDDSSTD